MSWYSTTTGMGWKAQHMLDAMTDPSIREDVMQSGEPDPAQTAMGAVTLSLQGLMKAARQDPKQVMS